MFESLEMNQKETELMSAIDDFIEFYHMKEIDSLLVMLCQEDCSGKFINFSIINEFSEEPVRLDEPTTPVIDPVQETFENINPETGSVRLFQPLTDTIRDDDYFKKPDIVVEEQK